MHANWHAHSHSSANGCLVECFTASRHIDDFLTETVISRSGAFLQHNASTRRKLRNCAAALSRGRSSGGFRNLCPRERSRDCQCHTEYYLLHLYLDAAAARHIRISFVVFML